MIDCDQIFRIGKKRCKKNRKNLITRKSKSYNEMDKTLGSPKEEKHDL